MVGTLLATFVAAFFGIHAIFQAKESRREEENAKRELVLERTGQRLIEQLDALYEQAPVIDMDKYMELGTTFVKYRVNARSPEEHKFVSTMEGSFNNLQETGRSISNFYDRDNGQKRPDNEITDQLEYARNTHKEMVKSIRNDVKLLLDAIDAFNESGVLAPSVFESMATARHGHSDYKDYVEQTLKTMYLERTGSHK